MDANRRMDEICAKVKADKLHGYNFLPVLAIFSAGLRF